MGLGSAVAAGRRWAGFCARFAAAHVDSNNVWQIEVYEGELSAGIQSGRGLCLKEDGSLCVPLLLLLLLLLLLTMSSYCGQWDDQAPNGIGCLVSSDGSGFKGQWSKGQQHGIGESITPAGDVYIGNFHSGCVLYIIIPKNNNATVTNSSSNTDSLQAPSRLGPFAIEGSGRGYSNGTNGNVGCRPLEKISALSRMAWR